MSSNSGNDIHDLAELVALYNIIFKDLNGKKLYILDGNIVLDNINVTNSIKNIYKNGTPIPSLADIKIS